MKPLTSSFLLMCLCVPLAAGEIDQKRRVKEAAQAMADAFFKADFEKFARYTNPLLLKEVGGRDEMIAGLKAGLADMKARGVEIRSYQVAEPSSLAGEGKDRFAIVPTTLVMTLPGTKVTMNSCLIGASEDAGKTWTFLDGAKATPQTIRKFLPNFPETLKLPAQQPPLVEKTR